MSTTLAELRRKVNLEVSRGIIAKLLEAGITFHTRKGLREGCHCDFCATKKHGTYRLSYCAPLISEWDRRYSEGRNPREEWRDAEREKLRAVLKHLKEL